MKKWIPSGKSLRIVRKVVTYVFFVLAGLYLWVQQTDMGESIVDLREEIETVRLEAKVEKGKFFELRKNFAGINGVENGAEILFRMGGSNSIGDELAPALAAGYLKEMGAVGPIRISRSKNHSDYILVKANIPGQAWPQGIEIRANGSSEGFKSLATGRAQIAMSSREITVQDVEFLNSKGLEGMDDRRSAFMIGLDGVGIIVNPANPITSLTPKQIQDVFSGRLQDWILIGGGNGKIQVYTREPGSGTRDFFQTVAMGTSPFANSAKIRQDNQDLHDAVLKDVNGIAFVSLPYIGKAKAIAILGSDNVPIHPFTSSVEQRDYPLARNLYFYVPQRMENFFAREFVQFVQSEEGQNIVNQIGYVPSPEVGLQEFDTQVVDNLPDEFKAIIKKSDQLALAFRFQPGKVVLDTKSEKDLIRLQKFLTDNKNAIEEVYLVGLSDNAGQADENLRLSLERAKVVKSRLLEFKLPIKEQLLIPTGFGDVKPVAPNTTEEGRNKNRRVEIWVVRK